MYGYIYETTNLVNGKKYIGQKKSNKFTNYLGSGKIICQAIKKYGKENFEVKLIEECISQEHLNEKEIYWIDFYNAVENKKYYNISFGGSSPMKYRKHTEEHKQKISEGLKKSNHPLHGSHHSEETKKKMSNSWNYEKHFNDEIRKKRSNSLSGEKNPFYGKCHSEETKKKMSKKKNISEETKLKRLEYLKNRKLINNGLLNKYIMKEEIDIYLNNGWFIGRYK